MKKTLFAIMMMALCAVGFTSCGSDDTTPSTIDSNEDSEKVTSFTASFSIHVACNGGSTPRTTFYNNFKSFLQNKLGNNATVTLEQSDSGTKFYITSNTQSNWDATKKIIKAVTDDEMYSLCNNIVGLSYAIVSLSMDGASVMNYKYMMNMPTGTWSVTKDDVKYTMTITGTKTSDNAYSATLTCGEESIPGTVVGELGNIFTFNSTESGVAKVTMNFHLTEITTKSFSGDIIKKNSEIDDLIFVQE